MFKSIFGKKDSKSTPKKGKTAQNHGLPEAIQNLQKTEDLLLKKQSYLESKIEKELKFAKQNSKTNKNLALQALKRKKRYEQQLETLNGTLNNLEQQKYLLDRANINSAVVSTMENSSKALREAQKNIDAEKVESLLDTLADQKDQTEEMANIISQPIGFGDDFDDDELAKELEELELSALEEDPDLAVNLPDVPVTIKEKPASKKHNTRGKEVPVLNS